MKDFGHKDTLLVLSEDELIALKAAADGPGLRRLAAHLALLAATGATVLVAPIWPLWLLASIVHGVVLVFLFTAAHESIHGTAFRTQALNRMVAEAAGFLLLLPPNYFRYFHFAHHRHTQDRLADPELASPRPDGWGAYLWYLSGLPYWRAQATALIAATLGRKPGSFVPAKGLDKVVFEARAHLAALAAILSLSLTLSWTWPLELWVLPALLGQPFLRAYLLAEHAACPFIADMMSNTRTTYTNRCIRFLAWNMPYHTAHHALPAVPFHRLGQMTALIAPRLKCTAEGYVEVHRQVRRAWRNERSSAASGAGRGL